MTFGTYLHMYAHQDNITEENYKTRIVVNFTIQISTLTLLIIISKIVSEDRELKYIFFKVL